jgi:hypothetical protein
MATFVPVHRAWSGAHGFRLVRPRLRTAGHDVFTPSLTGIGERRRLLGHLVVTFTETSAVATATVP